MIDIKGLWRFNDNPDISTFPSAGSFQVYFTSAGRNYIEIGVDTSVNALVYIAQDGTREVYDAESGWDTEYQTIKFNGTQSIPDDAHAWILANASLLGGVFITYNGVEIASIANEGRATLRTKGKMMEDDLTVVVASNSGSDGDCSGEHVIPVDELPTENIDTNAVYLCKGAYYKYVVELLDVLFVYATGVTPMSFAAQMPGSYFHYAETKPTENIGVSSDAQAHFYYIADENDVCLYGDIAGTGEIAWNSYSELMGATCHGVVSDASEVDTTTVGLYAVAPVGWRPLVAVYGELTITEDGTYDVTEYASVVIDIPSAAVCGIWRFNDELDIASILDGVAEGLPGVEIPVDISFTYQNTTNAANIIRFVISGQYYAMRYETSEKTFYPYSTISGDPWGGEDARKVINFGDAQSVPSSFKNWLLANATRIEESGEVVEEYDGTITIT